MEIKNEMVGMKLRSIREFRKSNLRDLAKDLKVRFAALNKIENGTQRLDIETLAKLAKYFNVPTAYFLDPNMSVNDAVTQSLHSSTYSSAFQRVLSEYLIEKKQSLKNNKLGQFVRNELVEIINTAIPLDEKKYLVTGSVGQGVWANIPWLSCFDRSVTLSAQHGYYMVYLFKEDMSGFYLSLNQGYTYFKSKYGTKEGRLKMQHTANILRSKIEIPDQFQTSTISLESKGDLAVGYENGHIFGKYYDAKNLPNDSEMISDFRIILDAYKKIVLFMNNRDTSEFNDYLLLQEDLEFLDSEEESYQESANDLSKDISDSSNDGPRPPKDVIIDDLGKKRYPRSALEAALALSRANYTCEIDPSHKTFISKSTNKSYVEAHHFVGISQYTKFPEVDLDRAGNIVCLCPNCHRKIHHAEDLVRLQMIEKLLPQIKNRLEKVGIEVTLTQLKDFYNINLSRS